MKLIWLIIGIFVVAFAFSYSRKVGALLLIVVVLGMLLSAKRKNLI